MIEQKNGYRVVNRRGIFNSRGDGHAGLPGPTSYGYGLFATPRTSGQSDSYRPRLSLCDYDQLSGYDWRELVGFSRQLFAQRPNIATAILQKNIYAVGDSWKPHFKGVNTAWGEEASDWLYNDFYPNCDLRGGVHDFITDLFVSGIAFDVDGDDLMVLTEDDGAAGAFPYGGGRVGYPKLKFCSATMVGSGKASEVKGGPFDGARIENGVVLDRHDAMVGVKVLKPRHEYSRIGTNDDGVIIPAGACQLMYEPEFRAFTRGVPRLAKAILDAFDVQDIDGYLKGQVKLNASQGLIKHTVSGEPDHNSDLIVEQSGTDTGAFVPSRDVKVEKVNGVQMVYLTAGSGEEVKSFEHSAPHANVENFIRRLDHRCISAVGWFQELLDPSQLRGACVRLIQDEARHSVWYRQRTLKKRARRAVIYAVARAMQTGRLPKNYEESGGVPDFMRWTFNLPAQITVDAGYDEDADRENFKLGTSTMAAVCEKKGRWWKDNRKQRLEENKDLLDRALELVAHAKSKGEKLTLREALDMMQQFGPAQRQEIATIADEGGAVV